MATQSYVKHLAETARALAGQRERWQRLVDFDPLTRYYAQLESDERHEAWLLTWLPGQGTPWHDHGHDHGPSAGSFVVLQGVLTEQVAGYRSARDLDDARRATGPAITLGPGDQRSFGGPHLHRVTNVGPDPVVSLHVYAPKLTTMTTYRSVDGVLEPVADEDAAHPDGGEPGAPVFSTAPTSPTSLTGATTSGSA